MYFIYYLNFKLKIRLKFCVLPLDGSRDNSFHGALSVVLNPPTAVPFFVLRASVPGAE